MSTIKERFAEKFGTNGALRSRRVNERQEKAILSFIQAELLLLAEEVEKSPARSVFEVAALIRSKAAELN